MPNDRLIDSQCWHCGKQTSARHVGDVNDKEIYEDPNGPSHEYGTVYELFECQECKNVSVRSGHWHEDMEPDDYSPSPLLPTEEQFLALRAYTQICADRRWMQLAVAEARKCKSEPGKKSPSVGAVLASETKLLGQAYRGEFKPGDHAEYTLLYKKLENDDLTDTVLYTTLEPCTKRNPPKRECVAHIIHRKISRVVIGMLDPNDEIRGRGVLRLRDAGIHVDLFPPDLMRALEGMNHVFIRDQKDQSESRAARTQDGTNDAVRAADQSDPPEKGRGE